MLKHEVVYHIVSLVSVRFFSLLQKIVISSVTAVLIRFIRFFNKKNTAEIIYVQFGAGMHNHVNVVE